MLATTAFCRRVAVVIGLSYGGLVAAALAQTPRETQRRYRAAYRLIRRSPEFRAFAGRHPRVAVYDSLIRPDRPVFAAELLAPRPLSAWLLDSLEQTSQTLPTAWYDAAAARLTNTSPLPKGTIIVALAPGGADYLLAEVSCNRSGPIGFQRVSTFSQSLMYLIYLDHRGRSRRVYTQTVAYD